MQNTEHLVTLHTPTGQICQSILLSLFDLNKTLTEKIQRQTRLDTRHQHEEIFVEIYLLFEMFEFNFNSIPQTCQQRNTMTRSEACLITEGNLECGLESQLGSLNLDTLIDLLIVWLFKTVRLQF